MQDVTRNDLEAALRHNVDNNQISGAFDSDGRDGVTPEVAADLGYTVDFDQFAEVVDRLEQRGVSAGLPEAAGHSAVAGSAEIIEIEDKLHRGEVLTQDEARALNRHHRGETARYPRRTTERPGQGRHHRY